MGTKWVEFGFDLGGSEKDIGLEKNPVECAPDATEEFVANARRELISHLQGLQYSVVERDY